MNKKKMTSWVFIPMSSEETSKIPRGEKSQPVFEKTLWWNDIDGKGNEAPSDTVRFVRRAQLSLSGPKNAVSVRAGVMSMRKVTASAVQ